MLAARLSRLALMRTAIAAGARARPATTAAAIPRGQDRRVRAWAVGDVASGFRVLSVIPVPELNVTAISLAHPRTGARYLHLDSSDPHNTFAVAFRTPPRDSTGVFHILEHMVLCSSRKYQEKDVFFSMTTRSLATFMNAYTASDYTMYPFSTCNAQDYANLLSVYCDSVFFPNLHEADFRREGHRLEFSKPGDRASPLVRQGIVFNEMKGALAEPGAWAYNALKAALFTQPASPYVHSSGGDPQAIPDLSYAALRAAHAEHYNAANASFLSYGDLPLERTLATLESDVLTHFPTIDTGAALASDVGASGASGAAAAAARAVPSVFVQPRVTAPLPPLVASIPVDPLQGPTDSQHHRLVAFLCGPLSDCYEGFTMSLLSSLLMSGPAAPMYKALLDSRLGTDYSVGAGFSHDTYEGIFSFGVQGATSANLPRVLPAIEETLRAVRRDGFAAARVDAYLHQVELSLRHKVANFGLNLTSSVAKAYVHGVDPAAFLAIGDMLRRFDRDRAQGLLEHLVDSRLLANAHKRELTLTPSETFFAERAQAETDSLARIAANLDPAAAADIVAQAEAALAAASSSSPDAGSSLPCLSLSDIPRELPVRNTTRVRETVGKHELQTNAHATNGLVYIRTAADLSALPVSLHPAASLLAHFMTELGDAKRSYDELALEIERVAGKLDFSHALLPDVDAPSRPRAVFKGVASALERNVERALELFGDVLATPQLDNRPRLATLVAMHAASEVSAVSDAGHRLASLRAASLVVPIRARAEELHGLTQIQALSALAARLTRDGPSALDPLVADFTAVHSALMSAPPRFSLVCEPAYVESAAAHVERLSSGAPSGSVVRPSVATRTGPAREFVALPLQVNFVAQAFRGVGRRHPDYMALQLLGQVLSSQFLLQEIRFKGGAYGGGATVDEGLISMYSYRDPSLLDTLRVFARAADWASARGSITDETVRQAKLSVFASIDAPVPPSAMGESFFAFGITDEERQRNRSTLLDLTRDDLVRVAVQYLGPARVVDAPIVVLGGADAFHAMPGDEKARWTLTDAAASS